MPTGPLACAAMAAFLEVPPTTSATELIHVTWAPEWRPVLARFGEACDAMPPAERVRHFQPGEEGYEDVAGGGDALTTWTLPAAAFDGRDELRPAWRSSPTRSSPGSRPRPP